MVDGIVQVHLNKYHAAGDELIIGDGAFVAPRSLHVALRDGGERHRRARRRVGDAGPRVGFAYDVQGHGKTVARAGYGLFYAQRQQVNSTAQMLTDIPFYNLSPALNGGVGGPWPTASSPTPTISWNNLLTNAAALPGGTTIPRYFPLGQVHQWSLSVQRQVLSDTALELDYVGPSGHKPIRGTTVNQIDILGEVYPKGTRPFFD